jgi:hypothetical protein
VHQEFDAARDYSLGHTGGRRLPILALELHELTVVGFSAAFIQLNNDHDSGWNLFLVLSGVGVRG